MADEGEIRFTKASIGEGKKSCDICGSIGGYEDFHVVYFGEKGEHMDVCRKRCRK